VRGGEVAKNHAAVERAWRALGTVPDPEIPVLTVVDLGIVRFVEYSDGAGLRVGITPTYSGCPATTVMRQQILDVLLSAGFESVSVYEVLFPAWTTDWMSDEGRRKLHAYGVVPPPDRLGRSLDRSADLLPACPRCYAQSTERLSEFGSTPCKALYRCTSCLEPFERFKCI
jgi:ring-1,2-phenylacetyl-CoA epoxidase subunit PaaD